MTGWPDFDPDTFLPYLLCKAAEAVGRQFATIHEDRRKMLNAEWRVLRTSAGEAA